MKHSIYAAAFFSSLATANPQWGPGGQGGLGGPWAAFPSCVSSCRDQNIDYNSYSSLCSNNDALNTLSTCVDNSDCSDDDKSNVKETIAQLCVNAGVTVTAAPYTTFSVTSGEWAPGATAESAWSSWASANGVTASSAWASWASANGFPAGPSGWSSWAGAHPSEWSEAASEFNSWTSAATLTAWPSAESEWSSITSAHPLPSDVASWLSANGWAGGSAWPSAWTSNSAWASVVSAWNNGNITAAPGWHGGAYGPFGRGGPGGSGWGNGPWSSNGDWTDGPWTNWWGTGACPPSTWSGWTDGSWSNNAPWTTWTACTAETTTTSVYTTTTTSNGVIQTTVGTSYGYGRVAEATNDVSTTTRTGTSDSGAMATNFAVLGSAAGALGVLAGAILL